MKKGYSVSEDKTIISLSIDKINSFVVKEKHTQNVCCD